MDKFCEICGKGPFKNLGAHERGKTHKKAMVAQTESTGLPSADLVDGQTCLDPDLQAIVDQTEATPQFRARATRLSFSVRGWPNAEHPSTVRDFLEEHGIPCL